MARDEAQAAVEITLTGLVQGVGFRPFAYRLARRMGLRGSVCNLGNRVLIRAAGPSGRLDAFADALVSEAPPLARIDRLSRIAIPILADVDFRILESGAGTVSMGVVPDIATCPACRAETADPRARRFRYAFTNCTDCGPRFSIVNGLPYDRAATTMAGFALCPACAAEYGAPADRRFHAQPIACPDCGPRLRLEWLDGTPLAAGAAPFARVEEAAVPREGQPPDGPDPSARALATGSRLARPYEGVPATPQEATVSVVPSNTRHEEPSPGPRDTSAASTASEPPRPAAGEGSGGPAAASLRPQEATASAAPSGAAPLAGAGGRHEGAWSAIRDMAALPASAEPALSVGGDVGSGYEGMSIVAQEVEIVAGRSDAERWADMALRHEGPWRGLPAAPPTSSKSPGPAAGGFAHRSEVTPTTTQEATGSVTASGAALLTGVDARLEGPWSGIPDMAEQSTLPLCSLFVTGEVGNGPITAQKATACATLTDARHEGTPPGIPDMTTLSASSEPPLAVRGERGGGHEGASTVVKENTASVFPSDARPLAGAGGRDEGASPGEDVAFSPDAAGAHIHHGRLIPVTTQSAPGWRAEGAGIGAGGRGEGHEGGAPKVPTVGADAEASADPIAAAAAVLWRGGIVAVKGIGGFHLACDATDAAAVDALRRRKGRPSKPLAVMADLDTARRICVIGAEGEALLAGPAAPIVLLPAAEGAGLAPGIAPGQRDVGVMLPATPLHHMLLEAGGRPLVMTSGNASGTPQVIDDAEARVVLAGIADAVLGHDRPIARRLDDSVMRIAAGRARVLRRGRGLAPMPMTLPEDFAGAPPVLALGGELKSAICLTHEAQALLSHHLGDLDEPGTADAFDAAVADYSALFAHTAAVVAVDPHPGYRATRFGVAFATARKLPLDEVQHHHAHMAAAMAEAGWPRRAGAVVGLVLDGLGLGADGTLWGAEILVGDYLSARRAGRLSPIPLIGGDAASREPWRVLLSHLDRALGRAAVDGDPGLREVFSGRPVATLRAMADKGLNAPLASSAGRLFDAVAALLGLAPGRLSHEGEAAMALEACARMDGEPYPFATREVEGVLELDPAPLWRSLLADRAAGCAVDAMAGAFHRGLAHAFADGAAQVAVRQGLSAVAVSGGVFQNALLLEAVTDRLAGHGLRVLSPAQVPANDGGLAFGQAAIAAARHMA